jgi:DNA-binding IclR family transcriptional regulator
LIRARLADVRRNGYAWVHEEFAEGLNSVAAPIADRSGVVVAAVHVHGPSYRFPGAADESEIAATVGEAAGRISARLRQSNG